MRVLPAIAIVAAAVWCFSAAAGSYQPPGGDYGAQWLSDSVLVFVGVDLQNGYGVHTVDVDASSPTERFIGPGAGLLVSPNRQLLAFQRDTAGRRQLVVTAPDGSHLQTLFDYANVVGWLADSSRLFFAAPDYDGITARLYSVKPDGGDLIQYPANVHGVPSPRGDLVAYEPNTNLPRIHLLALDGSTDTTIATGSGGDSNPVWSPDGSHLAFWSGHSLTVLEIGGRFRVFAIGGTGSPGGISWSPDGRTVYAALTLGMAAIDVATSQRKLDPGLRSADFSPDGKRVAYSAGGECRDRVGIYVVAADGAGARRVSNSCRVVGTDGPDVLHGSFSQVVVGLDGSDTLYADDTYYFFDGNTLFGGPGDDRLVGGYGQDKLYGGPGDDTLSGGPSIDVLVGGPGHDHIDGGGGADTIGARDGQRDWVSCGSNGYGLNGGDVVYADRIDVVAADCEIVHRR